MIHTGARTTEKDRIAKAQKKRAAKRDFTLPPAPQPARHTHAPKYGRVLYARILLISYLAHTWPTNHDIIVIIEEVMVTIGNDGRTRRR